MDTSAESYYAAKASGLINARQLQIIEFMLARQWGGVTQGEVTRHFRDTARSFAPRFKELEEQGIIRCVGTRRDSVTGRRVNEYRLTGGVIQKRKKADKVPKVCPRCEELRAEIEWLKTEMQRNKNERADQFGPILCQIEGGLF